MKTLLILCITWMFIYTYSSGQVLSIGQIKTEPVTVNTGITFKLHSKVLHEDRTIMISVPDGYSNCSRKYPVLYLLDGQWGFSSTAQAIGWLSNPNYGMIPQMIVVGIHTGDNRMRDLAPTFDNDYKAGGGADKLYKFICEELVPFVDKNYRTFNYRIIGGASMGGLFVMYAFINNTQLFNGYLSLSPSMWWDKKVMLERIGEFLSKNSNLQNRIYLALANEGVSMGVDSLASLLEKYSSKDLLWKYDKHPEEVHETVGYKGTWDGLKFLLADWYYPLVDFGTKEHLFSSGDTVNHAGLTHKGAKVSDKDLDNYSGLYIDSYNRILVITKSDNNLQLSGSQFPGLTLYPESDRKFFLDDQIIQKELFLKGFCLQFEFLKEDSLLITANGKIDCTAKKIKCPPLVLLSDEMLDKFKGIYLSPDQNSKFTITQEGSVLKLSGDMVTTFLYPVGASKFFLFINGEGFELEFILDNSKKVVKANVLKGVKKVFEADKVK